MIDHRANRSAFSRMFVIAVLSAAAFGCGSPGGDRSSAPAPAGNAAANGEVVLTLAEFQLVDDHGKPLNMSKDGAVTGPDGAWGSVHADGTVTSPDGTVRGKLSKTGALTDAQGNEIGTIAGDGTAKLGSRELHFGDDGKLVGGNPGESVQLKTQTPDARRAAMLVLVMAGMHGK